MGRKLLIAGLILCVVLIWGCTKYMDSSSKKDFEGSVDEPFALRAAARKTLPDKYDVKPLVIEVNSLLELKWLIWKYKIQYESYKIDYDFNRKFFRKNKLYLVLRNDEQLNEKCEMTSFLVDADKLNIVFTYITASPIQEDWTLGFIVATSREKVKDVKGVIVKYK